MQTDVSSSTLTADGTLYAARTRVKGLNITTALGGGSVILKDGGASGTALITINCPAVVGMVDVLIPGSGVLFSTNVYLDLTTVTSVTIFYG